MVEETRESRRVGSRLSWRSAVHAAVSRLRADLTKPGDVAWPGIVPGSSPPIVGASGRRRRARGCRVAPYRPAPLGPGFFVSPADRSAESAYRGRHLVVREIRSRELVPPVGADSSRGVSVESPRGIALRRVDQPQRHVLTDNVNGHLEVTVIADDDGSVDVAAEDVDQHVTCDVDIAALLFAPCDGGHEGRMGTSDPCALRTIRGQFASVRTGRPRRSAVASGAVAVLAT